MRISELSQRSGVSLATIKFYLREGLLPAGERTAPNQANYGETHLERLSLIRTLREVAGLGVAPIRDVIRAIEDPRRPLVDVLAAATSALVDGGPAPADSRSAEAEAEVAGLFKQLGWKVSHDSYTRRRLAETLLALRAYVYPGLPVQAFIPYARAVQDLARMEINEYRAGVTVSRDRAVESAILGTVLWERVLRAMRRAAHEHYVVTGASKRE